MTDLPIIFSASMVRALLDGRKTMTRRLAWRERRPVAERDRASLERRGYLFAREGRECFASAPSDWQRTKPGDQLWVRETWQKHMDYATVEDARRICAKVGSHFGIVYAATPPDSWKPNIWRSPIHMPRWASRITLIVTATKIERVQEISEFDFFDEGGEKQSLRSAKCAPQTLYRIAHNKIGEGGSEALSHGGAFGLLFDKLHGHGSWDINPEVVILTFTVHKTNIDALPKQAATMTSRPATLLQADIARMVKRRP